MLITALRKDRESIYQRGFQEGFIQGFKKGLLLGEQMFKINMAKAMLAEGIELSIIIKATQLSSEEIEQLQHSQATDTNQQV